MNISPSIRILTTYLFTIAPYSLRICYHGSTPQLHKLVYPVGLHPTLEYAYFRNIFFLSFSTSHFTRLYPSTSISITEGIRTTFQLI